MLLLILLLPLAALYFLPSIVALSRHRQVGLVLVVNLFLGWTFAGWVGALAIAVSSHPQPTILMPAPYGYTSPPGVPPGLPSGPPAPMLGQPAWPPPQRQ